MAEQFLKVNELAGLLRVNEKTVRKLIHCGEIRAIKVGREWRITESALRAFTQERERCLAEKQDSYEGKYVPLSRYLSRNGQGTIELTFGEIEDILGFPLPSSARKYNAWWHEEKTPRAHKVAWIEAGYYVKDYSIKKEKVVFTLRCAHKSLDK